MVCFFRDSFAFGGLGSLAFSGMFKGFRYSLTGFPLFSTCSVCNVIYRNVEKPSLTFGVCVSHPVFFVWIFCLTTPRCFNKITINARWFKPWPFDPLVDFFLLETSIVQSWDQRSDTIRGDKHIQHTNFKDMRLDRNHQRERQAPYKLQNKLCFCFEQSWLVVSTHLKNISQNGNLPQIGVKIKNAWDLERVFVLSPIRID